MARKSSFKARVRCGTPHEMEEWFEYDAPNLAKNFLRGRVEKQRQFTKAFNLACDEQLQSISKEIDGLDPRLFGLNQPRMWEATDDHSGVTFRFEMEVTSK